jgi:hypothetical protein
VTTPEPDHDELPLEWWSDEELAEIVAEWEKEIRKGT